MSIENKGSVPSPCCEAPNSPYVPPTFEHELEQVIKRAIKHASKAQEALDFVKKNTEVFSKAKELGINLYLD